HYWQLCFFSVQMIARGKNTSDLFPAVVKNVACKNIEDPNQLIRASALRVLSSIRVPIIVPIMMLAIKEAASDMSPYVRKTAAHAIPKLYSLDQDQKDQLIEVIEKLLADKTTLVAGSVVMAFEEVCPERIDLIHKNYRKLCNLLIDVEEWGQVVIINMLTRYARTQFLNPNHSESLLEENADKAFYGSDEEDSKDEKADSAVLPKRKPYIMDPDHRLLLRNTKPLLQSRNAAVVMAVAQLYFHLAPKAEVGVIAKALVRLLRSHSEVQFVVLQNVATMSIKRRGMFEPHLKSFYIRSTDPTQIKVLKLEVLTNLASETNISTILREFQTYIRSQDKDFVAATIQAIGRCATNIGEVRDTCLNGLVQLLSNRDELVVAESVVVIKKLLQMQPSQHSDIIKHMAKLIDNIMVPMARASILWLIGEYCEHVPKIAPDVLRKMAKSFTSEEDIVKLQIINLAAKLYLTNSKQTKLLTQYVLNLAKYDQNYDIRDRARFIRQLIVPTEKSGVLSKYAKKLFLAQKPAPVLESSFKDRDHFQLGSLSHLLNSKTGGYQELPDWPEVAPDPSVRNVEVPEWTKPSSREKRKEKVEKPFYSDSEEESEPTESADTRVLFKGKLLLLEHDTSNDCQDGGRRTRWTLVVFHQQILMFFVLFQVVSAVFSIDRSHELLHRITGEGLAVEYTFSRQLFSPQPTMVSVHLQFTNNSDTEVKNIHIREPKLQPGMQIQEFKEIASLPPGEVVTDVLGIDFCDSTQAANFQLCSQTRQFYVSIQPPVGELLMPVFLTENEFKKEQGKLMGMNEISEKLTLAAKCQSDLAIVQRVIAVANLGRVPCGFNNEYRFAARTVSGKSLVLVTVVSKENSAAQLTVNCEKMVIGTMLVKDITQALTQ
uniref:Adaptor related protein complex 3 subunit beta 2 n=1 Tax=Callorhinchus milii TaxID=7868 RepID=A0A4W3HMV7_CALMI